MLAWYLRLGGADMWSRCNEEADIDREIMPVGGGGKLRYNGTIGRAVIDD
jgi:hypothetical protein